MEQPQNEGSKRRLRLLWGLVVLLLLVNGVMFYQLLESNKALEKTESELVSTKSLKDELKRELSSAKESITAYKDEVAGLDSTIAQKNDELELRAERIEALIRAKRITQEQYNKAKKELDKLRYYAKKYQFQIDSLYRVNKKLKDRNQALRSDVQKAQKKAEALSDENARLSNKVALGARLQAGQLNVSGVKVRNNGEERETSWAGNLDKLRVCVVLEENLVAEKGNRNILVRLIQPDGSLLYLAEEGAQTFQYQGETLQYTIEGRLNFQNKQQEHCLYFKPENEVPDGDWKAELYTDNYKIGETAFRLRRLF
jgi:cell division protein ZapB